MKYSMRNLIIRRIGAAVLALALCFAAVLSGCGASDAEQTAEGISVVAVSFPGYDLARSVMGGRGSVTMLLSPGEEPHSYDPSPQDIIRIQSCDLFIINGGESETWVDNILSDLGSEVRVVRMMEAVGQVYVEELTEGMEGMEDAEDADDENGGNEPEYDEHVWTSPVNAVSISREICAELCAIDAENAESYKKNLSALETELTEIDAELRETVENGARSCIVVGDRFPFRYLAEEYGLKYYAAYPGCSTETEASAATVAFLIDKVETENIPVVFTIEFSNAAIAKAICEATGAELMTLHSCHNVSADDFAAGVTYADLMRRNADALKAALA